MALQILTGSGGATLSSALYDSSRAQGNSMELSGEGQVGVRKRLCPEVGGHGAAPQLPHQPPLCSLLTPGDGAQCGGTYGGMGRSAAQLVAVGALRTDGWRVRALPPDPRMDPSGMKTAVIPQGGIPPICRRDGRCTPKCSRRVYFQEAITLRRRKSAPQVCSLAAGECESSSSLCP